MKLIVDRGIDRRNYYSYSFGVDFDVLIGKWEIFMPVVPKEIMAQVDKIVTNSPNKVFCVTHIKHPLLLKSYGATLPEKYNNVKEEITFKQDLRHYFALRLQHRRYPVELYEFGKRLF